MFKMRSIVTHISTYFLSEVFRNRNFTNQNLKQYVDNRSNWRIKPMRIFLKAQRKKIIHNSRQNILIKFCTVNPLYGELCIR